MGGKLLGWCAVHNRQWSITSALRTCYLKLMMKALVQTVRSTITYDGTESAHRSNSPLVVSEEVGFTLVELMVVLLIMAILLAIAIPTFIGVTAGANAASTKSLLSNAVTDAQEAYYENQDSFASLKYPNLATQLRSIDSSITYLNPGVSIPEGSSSVSVRSGSSPWSTVSAELVAFSNNGTCYFAIVAMYPQSSSIAALARGGIWYNELANVTTCSTGLNPPANAWSQSPPN